ncbi:transposase [Nonomuraea antimicrobica]
MRHHDLTNAEWERVAALLPIDDAQRNRSTDDRTIVNGLLYQARTGVRWRCLPERYGCWVSIYRRHRRWRADGTWQRLMYALQAGTAHPHQAETPPDFAFPGRTAPAPAARSPPRCSPTSRTQPY